MTEKKEIKVKKSLLTLILKSVILSILTLFIIMHFGKTYRGGYYDYGDGYALFVPNSECWFWSPFEGRFADENSTQCDVNYFEKVTKFYLPNIFYYPLQLLIGVRYISLDFNFVLNKKVYD